MNESLPRKIKIDKNAMHKIKDIALREFHDERRPDVFLIHLKSLSIFLKQQGIEPNFEVQDASSQK